MSDSPYANRSDEDLRTEIARMGFEIKRRSNPKWTGRHHDWDKPFEHPLQRQCQRCGTPMVPLGVQVDFMDANAVTELYLREECRR